LLAKSSNGRRPKKLRHVPEESNLVTNKHESVDSDRKASLQGRAEESERAENYHEMLYTEKMTMKHEK
jgi:hypothetical protein